ncbi:MAG: VacJ family lipoprotein [Roseobacter sp.]
MPLYYSSRPSCRVILALAAAALVMACTTSQDPATRTDGINDPYEAQNRSVHAFNKGLDRNLVRPVSKGYAAVIPPEIRESVTNFANNLSEPGDAINSLLQGDLAGAGIATTRFAMNSTLGLFGFFDPSTELNIEDHDTDFGETLAVWGVGEGAYIEMPIFGPSTQRDAIGFVTDVFTNPLTFVTVNSSPENLIPPVSRGAAWLNDRDRLGTAIDSVLYDSADSYAQTRSIYLQSRRFDLDGAGAAEEDPYLDPYDPYDPYAE